MISKSSPDEGLFLNALSIKICISELIDYVNSNASFYEIRWLETSELLKLARTDGINRDHLSSIDETRLDEPVIISTIGEEEWIVDGNHRLIKRYEKMLTNTPAIVIPKKMLSKFTENFSLW